MPAELCPHGHPLRDGVLLPCGCLVARLARVIPGTSIPEPPEGASWQERALAEAGRRLDVELGATLYQGATIRIGAVADAVAVGWVP